MARHPNSLLVIFDGECLLCRRSAHWLERQRTYVTVNTIQASSPDVVAAYGDVPGYGDNIVVVGDDGRIWVGPPDAYLVVMWAVRGLRALSYLLSLPVLEGIATRVFNYVAGNRYAMGRLAGEVCASCGSGHERGSVIGDRSI